MIDIWKDRNWGPMLLKEIDEPFDSEDYIFELKFDGFRAIVFATNKEVYIQSRNKMDLTKLFPELQDIKKIIPKGKKVIFDGELVTFVDNKPSFSDLQTRIHIKDTRKIFRIAEENPVVFVCFDVLYENKDLTKLPLLDRKKYLDKYDDNDCFIKTKMIPEKGIHLFKSVCKMGLEGIVAKNINGLYHISTRTDDFIKIKNLQRDEFYIGGYEEKKNGILSLAIGEYSDDGKVFHFAGKVSIGKKVSIYNKVKKAKKSKNYFSDFDEDIFYIKPTIIVNVSYLERTKSNHLRHPVFNDI